MWAGLALVFEPGVALLLGPSRNVLTLSVGARFYQSVHSTILVFFRERPNGT